MESLAITEDIKISQRVISSDINRLTNQIWKLIPMYEKEEDWLNQLNSIIVEISGLSSIFYDTEDYLILLSKLKGLTQEEIDFSIYRKTVFESISLLRSILNA